MSIPALCYAEILQGTKSISEWKKIKSILSVNDILYPTAGLKYWENASRIYFELRRKGKTITSLVDCLVAQMVLDCKGILLHHDKDYEVIKSVRPLKTRTYIKL